MSTAEILSELPALSTESRSQILERLYELQEAELLQGNAPTPQEKQLLDQALADFQRDGDIGTPWREVIARVTASGSR